MGRSKRVSDAKILRAIALSPDPVVTARELAEELDYTRDGIRKRLLKLEDDGKVAGRDVGARSVVWWLTPEGRQSFD